LFLGNREFLIKKKITEFFKNLPLLLYAHFHGISRHCYSQLSAVTFILNENCFCIHENCFCNISTKLRTYSKMNLDDLEKLITDFKIPGQTAKVTSDLFNVVKSLFAYTKKLQTEIDLLKGQTKPLSRPLMSSLFSTKTPDEQTSEKLLLHTVHREIREISNIECNAIISGTDYTSEDADKAIVDDVLTAIGSTVRHV
jgi:hypothetical protein